MNTSWRVSPILIIPPWCGVREVEQFLPWFLLLKWFEKCWWLWKALLKWPQDEPCMKLVQFSAWHGLVYRYIIASCLCIHLWVVCVDISLPRICLFIRTGVIIIQNGFGFLKKNYLQVIECASGGQCFCNLLWFTDTWNEPFVV